MPCLHRQLRTPTQSHPINRNPNPRPNNWHIPRKARNRAQEIPKQDKNPIQLDQETDQSPAHQDQTETGEESCCAFEFLAPREEEGCFLRPDYYCEAEEEEDLGCVSK